MNWNQSPLTRGIFVCFISSGLPMSLPLAWASPEAHLGPAISFEFEMRSVVEANLHELKAQGEASHSADVIDLLNHRVLNQIQNFVPSSKSHLPNGVPHQGFFQVDVSVSEAVLKSIRLHPVVSEYSYKYYNANAEKQGGDIGFCFGRAAYIDRMLQRLGVFPGSVRKIWAVGELKAWQFHVAAMVYTNQGWKVMDPLTHGGRVSTPQQWFREMQTLDEQTGNRKARVFITDANKFGALPGDYDKVQMGYRMRQGDRMAEPNLDQDWYRNYFVDMSKHDIHSENWPKLGLTRLVPSASRPWLGMLNQKVLNSTDRYEIPKEEMENPFTAATALSGRAAQ